MSNNLKNYRFKRTVVSRPKYTAEIIIVDFGMGNLGSIKNMLEAIGAEGIITSNPKIISEANKLILPGVGAFDNGMANIKQRSLRLVLDDLALNKKIPILGICLGMQLITQRSEEGKSQGLGWIQSETIKFKKTNIRIPHMGWNSVKFTKKHPLIKNLPKESRFYFVHSYHVVCPENNKLMETIYGYPFTSALAKGNIMGVQFHPEKSHKFGMQLLKNFATEV